MPRLRAITLLSLATSLFVPAAFAQNTNNARPGTINYVEGQVTINGQTLTSQSVGTAEVATGQTVATLNGKAEVLLTPGVFLRLGDNSAVTMVAPDLTKTEVQLDRGVAEVEVDQLYKQNDILIDQGPAQAVLLKDGLYEFDATANQVRVFDGLASVSPAQNAKKWITLKDHHSLAITGEAVKPADFNDQLAANQDPLYSWSKLRADYLGQANLSLAENYAGSPYNPGWMWDQGMMDYTWLPYDGMFMDPFGFGFYSPWYLYGGGFIYPGYGFGGGYYGGYGYRGGYGIHGPYRGGTAGVSGRGFSGGGLRSGVAAARGFSGGGGFRGGGGGGGGFHGGGGGGGRR
jgi:hypothetical protein